MDKSAYACYGTSTAPPTNKAPYCKGNLSHARCSTAPWNVIIRMRSTQLATDVFRCITDRFAKRNRDIELLIHQGYSFEEWLNWEAFLACNAISRWRASGRPQYRFIGVKASKDYADLMVEHGDTRVIAEVGHILGGTQSEWIKKLEHDKLKLGQIAAGRSTATLQVIVLASSDPNKPAWLPRLKCWQCATTLKTTIKFQGGCKMIVRGWSRHR